MATEPTHKPPDPKLVTPTVSPFYVTGVQPECPYRQDEACFRCILMGHICDQAIDPLEERFGEQIYHNDNTDDVEYR